MGDKMARAEEAAGNVSLETRTLTYSFGPEFLNLKTIALMLEFTVLAETPISNLIMVERHYLKEKLIREYDFSFGFCMPKSTNNAEFTYDLP